MSHRQQEYKLKHRPCVLCIIENPETHQLLMIKHLRGINQGFCNFPGGKLDEGESLHDAVRREIKEESGLDLMRVKCVGRIDIEDIADKDNSDCFSVSNDMHVYIFYSDRYSGELQPAKDEVELFWQCRDQIPYERMRDNDKIWLPEVLAGKLVHKIFFRDKNEQLQETENDDEDVESLLAFRARHYEMLKSCR